MNQFREYFGCDKETFKTYVKNLVAYNVELEKVYIAMIEEIKNRSLGKQINKVFATRVMEVFPEGTVTVAIGSASMFDSNKKISVRIRTKKFGGMEYKIENELVTDVAFRNVLDQYRNNTCSFDNRFIEASIGEIVDTININRKRVNRMQDAVKNMEKHLNTIAKATTKFIETMETVNPVFVDVANTCQVVYSSCVRDLKSFKYSAYENELDKSVELYTA